MALSSTPASFMRGAHTVSFRAPSRPSRGVTILPELAPANTTEAPPRRGALVRAAIVAQRYVKIDTSRVVALKPEATDAKGRLLVYTLTTSLLFLAFPAGFALLIYNILGGEDLRATSGVIAVTGVVMFAMMLAGIQL
jgi:hypothetical protein